MSISNVPALRDDETYRPAEAILGKDMTDRLSRSSKSNEPSIRESVKLLLEAAEILSPSFTGMGFTRSDLIEPTGSIPLTTYEPVSIVLEPMLGSSEVPPEHDEEMAEWDALYEEIRARLSILQIRH